MADSILIVEDEQDIATLISVTLQELSLEVTHCLTGESALERALNNDYSLVILDVMLPGISGLDVCRQLRAKKPNQAILMLTSRSSETDRVVGLELGADDYLCKPFSVRELQARARSLLRRVHLLNENVTPRENEKSLSIGQLHINSTLHTSSINGRNLDLTSIEFDLLWYLASHPDQVFSRSQLLSSVWGYHHSGYEHTVNSHINRLRSKIEKNATTPEIVKTVWGVGYKFNRQGVPL